MTIEIAASILSADMANLGKEVDDVIAAGASLVHFDVMDNHFVPNLTIGPFVCKALRNHGITAPIDVHLMIKPVDRIIPDFVKAGASCITFHAPATEDVDKTIELIKSQGCKVGIAINPDESIDVVSKYLSQLDLVLFMSVFPGFAGQKFIPEVLDKVKALRKMIDEKKLKTQISIDGGINLETIHAVVAAGVDICVAGSAIFGTEDYAKTIAALKEKA